MHRDTKERDRDRDRDRVSKPLTRTSHPQNPKKQLTVCMYTWQEDERIKELVGLFGTKRWAAIARCIPGRIGKQCRER
jgi:hypothetical protein